MHLYAPGGARQHRLDNGEDSYGCMDVQYSVRCAMIICPPSNALCLFSTIAIIVVIWAEGHDAGNRRPTYAQ